MFRLLLILQVQTPELRYVLRMIGREHRLSEADYTC
jgi:hypothetical protein